MSQKIRENRTIGVSQTTIDSLVKIGSELALEQASSKKFSHDAVIRELITTYNNRKKAGEI